MFKDVQDILEGIMNRKKFLSSLKIVLRGAEKSSFLNNSLVYFDDGKLSSFSDSMYISCPVGSTFTCQVEMKTLFDVLSKMTDRNIRIRFKKNYLLVEGEKAKLKLKTLEGMEIPQKLKNLGKEEFSDLPDDFLNGLAISRTSAASNDSSVLNGIYVSKREILSCDNFRISHYVMKDEVETSFIIPFKSATHLLKSNLNPTKILIDDNWVHFLEPDTEMVLSSILKVGEYPYSKIVEKLNKEDWLHNYIEFPKELSEVIGRAEILSSETTDNLPFIELKIGKDKIEVIGEKEVGKYYEELEGIEVKKEISFKASPDFLKNILQVTNKFRMNKDGSALLFSTDNFKHLVLTIKEKGDPSIDEPDEIHRY